jgi:hypothetical protein
LKSYRPLIDDLAKAQQDKGIGWMWEEDYSAKRQPAGVLLDLTGYLPAEKVEPDLRKVLAFHDPRLKYFALSSLIRLGKRVTAEDVAGVAQLPEMRTWLYKRLDESGQLAVFPAKFKTQAAFAEAEMVYWLTYPTELGRPPDEIELMKVVTVKSGAKKTAVDYYVFRFGTQPPHWAAKDGWLAGIAGPYPHGSELIVSSVGGTFSEFRKWDSRSPEEHVKAIAGIVDPENWTTR